MAGLHPKSLFLGNRESQKPAWLLKNRVRKLQKFAHMADDNKRIGELEDEIKHRDRRISEPREEVDELRDLVERQRENVEDAASVIEHWEETFEMVLTEGGWSWGPFWEKHNKLIDAYQDLVQKFNKYVHLFNSRLHGQNVGRPLAASEAQVALVLKLRQQGTSLRNIADETSLGLSTVRTIVGRKDKTDRTSKRHLERIGSKELTIPWKRQKRTGDSLPRRAQKVVEDAETLAKESRQ
jgi:Helix-turn-helix domain of resolvase